MIQLPPLAEFERPDLIEWVAATCVVIPHPLSSKLVQISDWCHKRMGEYRHGNILREAQEGHLDYFDGSWQIIMNPFASPEELCVWFADRNDQAAFIVTWL